ncbi:HEAT repeat domain-containing protein [Bremerella cremea]|uniref:HEAT repeat domain-containing protein n=1 Tax=Bremerella cremea TaxID=1031537 RepID=A0A368KWQ7_9BACT|nr:HEAT repeat domain-containing protein [Bremerella cremea]RCS54776.1 HEAT repeat domain-containing protein [Bremerella cremea]
MTRIHRYLSFCTAAIASLAILGGSCAIAQAEVFHLASGGTLEGTLLNPDQSPRVTYEVQTEKGKLVLGRSSVRDVVAFSAQLKQYETFLPRMPDTVEGQFQMARWCEQNNLPEKRDYHLNEILKREPDNVEARKALGYEKFQGKWIIRDEWNRQQGYVRYGGGWRYPQDIKMSEQESAIEEKQIEWRKQVRIWRTWLKRGGDRAQEAAAEFRKINDPYAGVAIIDLLKDEKNSAVKQLLVEALTNIKTPESTTTLTEIAANDPDESIRDQATIGLENRDNRQAVNYLISKLTSSDNETVNRAAIVLGRLKSPASVRPLIDALVTTHKETIQSGGQPGRTTAGFGTGGGGMSFGTPKAQVIERDIQNPGVRRALLEVMDEGVDFQYNEDAWKVWYANKKIPLNVDLRRDD